MHGEGLGGAPTALDALDAEAGRVLAEADEALWRHWTSGAPLSLPAGRDTFFSQQTLELLRADGSQRARHLEHFIVAELLARALASDTEAIASLEAGATFTLDSREVLWRDLPRLLVTEKSAVKRHALWAASGQVAERLESLLTHREQVSATQLAALGVPSALELWAAARGVSSVALARDARALLEKTDEAWSATLTALSEAELKLPVDVLTRADLPRLLKVPAAVDAAFPRAQVAPFALATLSNAGLKSAPGLTLDLTEAAAKKPLPLTVAPKPSDVRVSFKPVGGLRDMTHLLAEPGAAVAWRSASTGHASTDRLGDPAHTLVVAELFAALVQEPAWLQARGIAEADHAAIVAAARAQRLYALRRACMAVLLRIETDGLSDSEAHARVEQISAHALGVKASKEDALRLHLDLDEGLRAASVLKAAFQAALERERLGARWWGSPEGLKSLAPRLAAGTSAAWSTGMPTTPSPPWHANWRCQRLLPPPPREPWRRPSLRPPTSPTVAWQRRRSRPIAHGATPSAGS